MNWRASRGHISALLTAMLAAGLGGHAGDVYAELSGNAYFWPRIAVNDNRRLRESGAPVTLATINDLTLYNTWARPTYALNLNPKVRVTRYTQETVLNQEDHFVHLDGFKAFEKQRFMAQFDYENEGTSTTELTDSGRFDVNLKRTTLAVNGGWQYNLSELLEFNAFGGWSDTSFVESPGSGFVDYTQANAGVSLRYQNTASTALLSNASLSRFSTPSIGSETVSYAFKVGTEHHFDETLDVLFEIGQNISVITQETPQTFLLSLFPLQFAERVVTFQDTVSGQLLNTVVSKRFEQATVRIAWNRYFSPSSQGSRQKRQEVDALGEYRLNDDWVAELRVNYREQAQEGGLTLRQDALTTITTMGRLFYQVSPTIRAELAYTFLRQSSSSLDFAPSSNEIGLGLRYSGEKFTYLR